MGSTSGMRAREPRRAIARGLAWTLMIAPWTARAVALSLGASMELDCASPDVGPATGGTLVTLAGDGYGGSASAACSFDSTVVAPSVKTATAMTCLSPRYGDDNGGFVAIGLTLRRNGREATTAPLDVDGGWTFNFAKQMTVSNAYPTDAPVGGGEIIYLTGAHLHETRSVRWTKPVTHVSADVVSSAMVRVESPPVTTGEISSMIFPTFTTTQGEYDANVAAATSANQTTSIPPRSRGALGFVLETGAFSITNVTGTANTTGGTPVSVIGSGFNTVGGDDDGTFLSCYFGTIGPVDARVVGRNTAMCVSPAHVDDDTLFFGLGIGNGRFVLVSTITINMTLDYAVVIDPDTPTQDASDVTWMLMNPTLDVILGATPFDVVVGGSFHVRGSGMSFDLDRYNSGDGCTCVYPGGSSSTLDSISSALARCTNTPYWTTGEVKISCAGDLNNVVRSLYVAPVLVPTITNVDAVVITYQGGSAITVTGQSFPDEGESRSYSGCHFGPIGPVHARYMSGTEIECVAPALMPSQSALNLGFGATESVDLVQYGLTIQVTADTTSTFISPPLWLTPATTYVSAQSARIAVSDYQSLGTLSVGTLTCVFGTHNRTTTGTSSAPVVNCPMPPLMSPGFTVVRITRNFAAASLDPPASLLVKKDHVVYGAHPRQTWGPVDVISITGSDFLATNVEGTFDPSTSLCVFSNSAGFGGGVIVSSALITCESPMTESLRSAERWVKPCFEECSSTTALAVGSTSAADRDRVTLTSMVPANVVDVDAVSGWTFGGTTVRATLSVGVPSEVLECHFGPIAVRARPAGVAVNSSVAIAASENIEIDCVSPARERGEVIVHASLAQSRAPYLDGGVSFLYK